MEAKIDTKGKMEMKKLFALVLLAIIAAGVASPVYAQEGYPVDGARCSGSYWEGIAPADCVAYYENHFPNIAAGCGDMDDFTCVAHYESLIYAPEKQAAQSVDVPAGGEGPTHWQIKGVDWRIWAFYIVMILNVSGELIDKLADGEPTGYYGFLTILWIVIFVLFIFSL